MKSIRVPIANEKITAELLSPINSSSAIISNLEVF
jgi:hypothetical protein